MWQHARAIQAVLQALLQYTDTGCFNSGCNHRTCPTPSAGADHDPNQLWADFTRAGKHDPADSPAGAYSLPGSNIDESAWVLQNKCTCF